MDDKTSTIVSENLMAALISVYSILTAVIALLAAQAGGYANDNNLYALTFLNDSSELNLTAQFHDQHDTNTFEQLQLHQRLGSNQEIIDFLYGQFSAEALDSLDRSGGFDEDFYYQIFLEANVERDLSTRSLELAAEWFELEGVYQSVATVLAVGLALIAWASLLDRSNKNRRTFTIFSILILVVSIVYLAFFFATNQLPQISIDFDGNYQNYTFVLYQP